LCCSVPTAGRWKATTLEAARLAVAEQLNIKILIDYNNSTIAGRPQQYMPGMTDHALSAYWLPTETTMGRISTPCSSICAGLSQINNLAHW